MECILTGQVKNQNAITVPGGGSAEMGETLGSGPYTIEFDEEDNENLTASSIEYNNETSSMKATNVQSAIDELFTDVSEGKALIATAVTDKGVETAATDSFSTIADKIGQITTETPIETVDIIFESLRGISGCTVIIEYENAPMSVWVVQKNNYKVIKNSIITINAGSSSGLKITPQSAYESLGAILINNNYQVIAYKIIGPATITSTGGNIY